MKIVDVTVVDQDSAQGFERTLKEAVEGFQEKGLEVTINNPHLVNDYRREAVKRSQGMFTYVALVEGRGDYESRSDEKQNEAKRPNRDEAKAKPIEVK